MATRFHYTDADLEIGCRVLLEQQRPATRLEELDEASRGNLEADVEAVLEAVGGSYKAAATAKGA